MNNKEFLEILAKSIVSVTTDDGNVISDNFEIKDYIDKYSSLKSTSLRLFSETELVKTNGTRVSYKCPICNLERNVLLKKFLMKKTLNCSVCKEQIEDKKQKQSDYLKKSFDEFGIIKSYKNFTEKEILNIDKKIEISLDEFDEESETFKIHYFSSHLTEKEFLDIKDKIYKINGIVIEKDFKYIEILKINNQMKYSSFLYDKINDKLINFNNVEYICDNCSDVFNSTRKAKEKYNKDKKYLCPQCYMSNRIFKVKITQNINKQNIKYQSSPELKLINFCNEHNILIKNGPVVNFVFNDKERKYSVDYYIPEYNLIIEIKDNHIWHKQQVQTGKWELKEKAALQYAKENSLTYKLIFSQYLNEFINSTFKI